MLSATALRDAISVTVVASRDTGTSWWHEAPRSPLGCAEGKTVRSRYRNDPEFALSRRPLLSVNYCAQHRRGQRISFAGLQQDAAARAMWSRLRIASHLHLLGRPADRVGVRVDARACTSMCVCMCARTSVCVSTSCQLSPRFLLVLLFLQS